MLRNIKIIPTLHYSKNRQKNSLAQMKIAVALTFPPRDQKQFLRALSLHAVGRVRSHTFMKNTGEKILCGYN